MSITKAVLHFAAPLPKIESFDRFLFLGPHPDDIEIGAGATAADQPCVQCMIDT